MSNMEAGDNGSAAALKAADDTTRPGTTGLTKHGRHARSGGGGNWATTQKAAKEPAYKGPWVSERWREGSLMAKREEHEMKSTVSSHDANSCLMRFLCV